MAFAPLEFDTLRQAAAPSPRARSNPIAQMVFLLFLFAFFAPLLRETIFFTQRRKDRKEIAKKERNKPIPLSLIRNLGCVLFIFYDRGRKFSSYRCWYMR